MSKQPNDQEGVQKSSADAPQDSIKPNDAAAPASPTPPASTADASKVESSTPSGTDAQPASTAAKNGRSRRRGKGGSQSQAAANSTASGSTTPSGTASASTATPGVATPGAATSGTAKPSAASTAPSAAPASKSTPSGSGNNAPPTPPSGSGGKRSGGKGGLLALILVVLLAIALVIVAWQGWQRLDSQQQRINELSQQAENSATQQTVSDLQSRIESSESERDQALESTLDELRGELDSYRSDVNSTLDDVLAQLSQAQDTDDRDWLHAEAAYLLRLANQRLQLEGDVEGAAALLRTADARLADADNPALTSVRREIASELAALDGVPRVDRTGLYLALNAQQERVAGLRLSQEVEERAVTSGIEQPPTGTFQRQLARFGEELKDLVVIRHHDEAMETLVTPEQESYLRQSLRLILEQAQLALLKEEQPLYEASIDKALELLNGYYDLERDATQSVIERLQELKQAEIEPELPDISASQQAMASFIENRFRSRQQDDEEGGDA
ncbi:uroporphyrin-3 C-methyltransferase [Vreelandella songnenensis]|uniref:Uroporphyrin-3 C-methyltransferase n=1 Tax=Vreelandella songnenensis TaxID=1176243 RepID=A0A2T0V436_9GAMM|nr:uroporphyrinogen-III C-methyltransferase [Halomonas songnenensis]PRY64887.1 uroporphyrin-3 C-methyltransferase [Halomonas songnenensis]